MQDILAERSASGRARLSMEFEPGMVAGDVARLQGFSGEEALAIVVMVNSEQASADAPLHDGDMIELLTQMVGA